LADSVQDPLAADSVIVHSVVVDCLVETLQERLVDGVQVKDEDQQGEDCEWPSRARKH
jgi:hypothetical protein